MTEKDLVTILNVYMEDFQSKKFDFESQRANYLTKSILLAMKEAANTAFEQAAQRASLVVLKYDSEQLKNDKLILTGYTFPNRIDDDICSVYVNTNSILELKIS